MTTLPNGAYHLYLDASLPPIIVEIQFDWVWEVGDSHHRPLSSYRGRFVPLVEAAQPNDPPHGFYPGTPYPPEAAQEPSGRPIVTRDEA